MVENGCDWGMRRDVARARLDSARQTCCRGAWDGARDGALGKTDGGETLRVGPGIARI